MGGALTARLKTMMRVPNLILSVGLVIFGEFAWRKKRARRLNFAEINKQTGCNKQLYTTKKRKGN